MTVVATLTVSWPRPSLLDHARRRSVLVDGEVRGTLRGGGVLSLALKPGRHLVRATAGGAELPVHLGPGETVRLHLTTEGGLERVPGVG